MKPLSLDLDERLRTAYPKGTVEELNVNALENPDRDRRLDLALGDVMADGRVVSARSVFNKPNYSFYLTESDTPEFNTWTFTKTPIGKVEWIRARGAPYTVLLLHVSRVADFFRCHFNHWAANEKGDRAVPDLKLEPNEFWKARHDLLCQALDSHGFTLFSSEMCKLRTNVVKEHDFDAIDESDPKWDDPDLWPPIVDARLFGCLFSH